MTVTPLGRDQDCSLKNREPDGPAPWFLDPGGWSKTATVSLYFIFPGICSLSLIKAYIKSPSIEKSFSFHIDLFQVDIAMEMKMDWRSTWKEHAQDVMEDNPYTLLSSKDIESSGTVSVICCPLFVFPNNSIYYSPALSCHGLLDRSNVCGTNSDKTHRAVLKKEEYIIG
ncbi:hypothetical protein STEG23_013484, partial [Scotinomys teguina]